MVTPGKRAEDLHPGSWAIVEYAQAAEGIRTVLRLLDQLGLKLSEDANVSGLFAAVRSFDRNRELVEAGEADDLPLRQHLAFTILVPGSKADRALEAVQRLTGAGFFAPREPGTEADRIQTAEVLLRPLVRFYRNKTSHLITALAGWSTTLARLKMVTCLTTDLKPCYEYLVDSVPGLGRKAAAHFLRNLGLNLGPAAYPIIDTHIHKALDTLNFEHNSYREAETSFRSLAMLLGIPTTYLDACLWCAYSNNWKLEKTDFRAFLPEKRDVKRTNG